MLTVEERFWAKVDKTDTCWLWMGSKSPYGYGRVRVNRKIEVAHRLSYALNGGDLIDGLVLDHLCGVKNCVNPAHLEQVTNAENVSRAPHPGPVGQRWTKNGLGSKELGPCGTSGPYGRGCRCDACRAWNAARAADYRRRLKLAKNKPGAQNVPHPT